MKGAAWSINEKEYTLDYVLVNEAVKGNVDKAMILDEVDVVEGDHAVIEVDIIWRVVKTVRE